MLDVVSVSLGSATRDAEQEIELLGRRVRIRRIGTGGDIERARQLVGELDGKVDAIGLGGIDLYVLVRNRRYYFRDAVRISSAAVRTPVVCGSGLKNSLERSVIRQLAPSLRLSEKSVLMVSAVDRFGMAEELAKVSKSVLFGDLIFALGLPLPLSTIGALELFAHALMPVVSRVPFKWLYPTGEAQERETASSKFARYYHAADVIAGDWHFIKRYAPANLTGKLFITNTTTSEDLRFLRSRGAKTLVTTTPRYSLPGGGSRTVGTNLLEAALVAVEGAAGELTQERYAQLVEEAGVKPTILDLSGGSAESADRGVDAKITQS